MWKQLKHSWKNSCWIKRDKKKWSGMWIVSRGKWSTSYVNEWMWWGPMWTSKTIVTMHQSPFRRHPPVKCLNTKCAICTLDIWLELKRLCRNNSKQCPPSNNPLSSNNNNRCRCNNNRCRWCNRWWLWMEVTLISCNKCSCSNSSWPNNRRTSMPNKCQCRHLLLSLKSRNKPKCIKTTNNTNNSRLHKTTNLTLSLDRNLKIKSILTKLSTKKKSSPVSDYTNFI